MQIGSKFYPNSGAPSPTAELPLMLVVASSLFVLALAVWPLPGWAKSLRPELPLMLVVYWIVSQPFRIGMIYAWLLGVTLDLLTGSVLCQHALALTIVAYLVFLFHQRTAVYSMTQQGFALFGLVALYHLLNYWIYGLTGGAHLDFSILLSALTSALLWALFRTVLDALVVRLR